MGKSLRLGRVLGVPVEINATWVVIFVVLTFMVGSQLGNLRLGWPTVLLWTVAVASGILLFLSVLVHELSHSLTARSRGIPVVGITLFLFGGVSHLAREPERPADEFLISIVGPMTSIGLAAVLGGIWYAMGAEIFPRSPVEVMAFILAWWNLTLGVFNLLPGFPLDGGRVLRAVVWAGSGSHLKATQVAARCGQGVGLLIIAGGILYIVLWRDWLDGLWAALIGAFLFSVATGSYPKDE